jgi:ABC-2 type transport system permease protein
MVTGPVTRTLAVAEATVRGTFQGNARFGLAAAAALFPVIVLAIASANFSHLDLLGSAETLYSTLFLPVILLLVCLVQGVSLFRTELEEDTLLYPMKRTVPRPAIVAGKYLGFLVTTLLVLLPSAGIGIALAVTWGHGATYATAGLWEAILLLTTLGVAGYGAAFLFLGLLTRSALVIGLIYGFLWETFVSLLSGPIAQWTLVYYLRAVGYDLVPSGMLGGGPTGVSIAGAVGGFVLFALACLAGASVVLRYTEVRPAAAPS